MPKNLEQKVLVSTDIGSDIDDALSILAMFNAQIDVLAIYTVNGDVNSRAYIARHMANLAGKNIAVATGSSQPLEKSTSLTNPYWYFENCYVDDSFIDDEASRHSREVIAIPLEKAGIISQGTVDLAQRLNQEKYTIFSLGPLTNVAELITACPTSMKNITHLYIMGSSFEDRYEHNFCHDPIAAKKVLESDIPLTLIPAELCQKYRVPIDMLDALKSQAGKYVKRMARGFIATKIAQAFQRNEVKEYNLPLKQFIRDKIKPHLSAQPELEHKTIARHSLRKDDILEKLGDAYFGALDTEEYLSHYHELIDLLQNPQVGFRFSQLAIQMLKELQPTTISISDVYVPYCFLHPERLATKRGTVNCTLPYGRTNFLEGDKHNVVVSLDYAHFEDFVAKSLQ